MSQKLCEECKKFMEKIGLLILPSDHCHHEEEKKGCEACNPGASLRVELRGSFSWSNLDPKFCPNCGRKL